MFKNAEEYSKQIDNYIEYKIFLKDLKQLVENKEIDERNIKILLLFYFKLPKKYHKYVNMMYKDYFKK